MFFLQSSQYLENEMKCSKHVESKVLASINLCAGFSLACFFLHPPSKQNTFRHWTQMKLSSSDFSPQLEHFLNYIFAFSFKAFEILISDLI